MVRTDKRVVYNILIIILLLVGSFFILSRFIHFGNVEFTDNATVRQHITPVNTRVAGFISEIRFKDYQHVQKGDTLAIIDDAEFKLKLAQAEADYARALAGHRATNASIATTRNNIAVGDAGVEEALVQMQNAEREEKRFWALLAQNSVTQQQYDKVHTQFLAAKARYEQVSRARRTTALIQNEQTEHLSQNKAVMNLAEANIKIARLNLSYCAIIASANGVVGKKEIHNGQLVQPGQTITYIVDDGEKWVDANFRESQLVNIKPGCDVSVKADAVPDKTFNGKVESMSQATGSAISLIPTDNATGNFVKVEQRLPVRIKLTDADISELKAGYNVECVVKY